MQDSTNPVAPPQVPADAPSSLAVPPSSSQEQAPKLKGRQRLLAGLQRISSSPSVARLGTSSRSRGYSSTGRGSISCISLGSASSAGFSYSSSFTRENSSGYATPPTSAGVTPGIQIPRFDERARHRYVGIADGRTSVGLPVDVRAESRINLTSAPGIVEVDEDYFSRPVSKPVQVHKDFNIWHALPSELRMEILTYLDPKEIVRCARVSKAWRDMCFDGQLWSILDTAGFYQDIPADALINIITSAGPFVRDLNLRGCVQLGERWSSKQLSDACTNLENFSLEGCRIDRTSIHDFLWSNKRLVHINLSGLKSATDHGMKIIGLNCPKLEYLNISWCSEISTRGLRKVIAGCPDLKDLRAGETKGWDDVDFMHEVFQRNGLERLVLMNCDSLTDDSLGVFLEGKDSEIDFISGRPMVAPRRLKHLDLTRCRHISDQSLRKMVNNVPDIEGLQLSKCRGVVDATLTDLFPTIPMLTHLDLEDLEDLTNHCLQALAEAPFAKKLRHLSISYCEHVGDASMIPVLKACTSLTSLEMDNTRIGDLVLAEAASMVRQRSPRTTIQGTPEAGKAPWKPATGLRLVAYDCQNVTWTGVREIISRNADISITTHTLTLPPLSKAAPLEESPSSSSAESLPARSPSPRIHIVRSTTFPTEVIQLKCFYTYQPTVEEHTKRVLRGDFLAARRLERKWAEFMMAQEEAGAGGAGGRRRRRRAREAQMMHADEEEMNVAGMGVGGGRRRRARSGGCAVM